MINILYSTMYNTIKEAVCLMPALKYSYWPGRYKHVDNIDGGDESMACQHGLAKDNQANVLTDLGDFLISNKFTRDGLLNFRKVLSI